MSIASKATSLSLFCLVLHSTLTIPAIAKTNLETCKIIILLITVGRLLTRVCMCVCVCHIDETIVIVEIGSCDVMSIYS